MWPFHPSQRFLALAQRSHPYFAWAAIIVSRESGMIADSTGPLKRSAANDRIAGDSCHTAGHESADPGLAELWRTLGKTFVSHPAC